MYLCVRVSLAVWLRLSHAGTYTPTGNCDKKSCCCFASPFNVEVTKSHVFLKSPLVGPACLPRGTTIGLNSIDAEGNLNAVMLAPSPTGEQPFSSLTTFGTAVIKVSAGESGVLNGYWQVNVNQICSDVMSKSEGSASGFQQWMMIAAIAGGGGLLVLAALGFWCSSTLR